jgi:hypothetical protein
MPQQVGEVLDDLRLGRLSIRTVDPEAPRAADRLGRRVMSGLVISAALLGGSWLVSADEHIAGIVLFVVAGLWMVGHMLLDTGRSVWRRR